MARQPAPDTGQHDAPPSVTPDWVTDEDWELLCASHAVTEVETGLPAEDDDPDSCVPPDWAKWSVAEITAQAEADGAAHAAMMARLLAAGLEDGYAHRAGDPPVPGVFTGPAAGFGQARCLDGAPPESALAMLADEASGEDRAFKDVTDDQLLGVLSARARLEARQAWERLMAVAEFIRRRPKPGCPPGGGSARMPQVWDESAAGELRIHLHITPGEADDLLGLAHDLSVKLPLTSAALRDGVIDLAKARLIAYRCLPLTPEEARKVEAILFGCPDVAEWTYGKLRDRLARAIIEVNPQAAIRRRAEAARTRRVEVRAEDSGNAVIAGRELPPAVALAASQLLTARARQLRKAGLTGGMDELRVLAYLEKLGVLDPLSSDRPGGDEGPGAVPGGFAARVNMTLPLATLLGLAERPGLMPRIGPIDPALVRELAAAAARNPASTWCLTITDTDGRPVAHGCGRPIAHGCGRPVAYGRPPPRRQRQGGDRGPPGGYGAIRLSTAAITGTGGTETAGRDLVFALETLAGPCDHKHQATGHDPGRMLRHLTGILNATCTLPPCRRPESQADYEHSVPFGQGGKTCLCQAGPVCRTDHRHKQSPGWRLEQAGSRGWFRWTTPSGRTYLSRPTQYPY
jgi:Domain of unknown function (DUF222)